MRPLTASEIRGNWASLLLPINQDDSIDYGRLSAEIDFLIDCRTDGIYSNGTACEFFTQTEDEFDRVSTMVAERCESAGRPFELGASHTSPQTTLSRVRRAASLRPGAIQVILPDWAPVGDDEAIAFFSRLAEAAEGIGLVLYNPPHAKRVLTPPVFEKLRRAVPSLVGLKVYDGPASWYAQMRDRAEGLSVFVPGQHLATGVLQGASGSYSNVACLHPAGAQAWWRLTQTDLPAALSLEHRVVAFLSRHVRPYISEHGYCNAACDKFLAAIGGWADIGTRLRWPYRFIPQEEADRLRPLAREILPEILPS
ncbi:MAG: dihydrodipicolinate synthase family protein [Pirellulales bacterium]|nr:dihydrodipicolinate synthase family protein [Pirellulales bacterium]